MEAEPLVSVLMPAYNSAPFIGAAIDSVLAQTYPHFELLVIDDGSIDSTAAIAAAYQERDPRVQLCPQSHSGIAASRNQGLRLARGEYLAWLDSDDLAHPRRLELQVAALQTHRGLVILGSAYQTIDGQGVPGGIHQMPKKDTAIRWHCLFHSPFAQSSVILRAGVLRSYDLSYDMSMPPVEDYELWSRLLQHGQAANLPDPLAVYRLHATQASHRHQTHLRELAGQVAQKNQIALGVSLPLDQVQRLRAWYYDFPRRFSPGDLPLAEGLLEILNRFSRQPGLEPAQVRLLRGRWLGRLLRASLRTGSLNWNRWMLRQLTRDDLGAILAYLSARESL